MISTTDGLDCVIETAGSTPEINPAYAITTRGVAIVAAKRGPPNLSQLHKHRKLPTQKLCGGFIGFNEINRSFDLLAKGSVPRRVLRVPT